MTSIPHRSIEENKLDKIKLRADIASRYKSSEGWGLSGLNITSKLPESRYIPWQTTGANTPFLETRQR